MLRKLYLVPVLALFVLPAVAKAQFEAGNWALQLSGQGSNDKDFESGQFSINADLGYFLSKEAEIGLREGVVWNDGGSSWGLNSNAYIDYHFDMDRWQPFIGANIGKFCGNNDNSNDDFFAGPEVGVKYFVNTTTFVQAIMAYEFDLQEGFDVGSFTYGLSLGFKW
jgi:hypothetical protein